MHTLESVTEKIEELGLFLPETPEAKGNYLPYVIAGKIVTLSGTLPIAEGKVAYTGQVGEVQSIESGYESARLCALNALANLRAASNDFKSLKRIISVTGFVNSVNGFVDSPKVINGASDFLVSVFGESGQHARVAVSTNGLPLNATTETQIVAELV
ncbi:RidA family protein [Puniceicoccaceae bacterium K14]|nr:RidA family protein [Puniceicoccaceae bacterium K14]